MNIQADAAPSGQEFDKWTGDTDHVANVNSASTKVTMPADDVEVTATYEDLAYIVSASAGVGGDIGPESRTVSHGESTTFTVTPDQGYRIDTVTGCDGTLNGSTYTTGPVTSDCTVEASFSPSPIIAPDPGNPDKEITATVQGGGSSNWVFTEGGNGKDQTAGFIPVSGHPKSPSVDPPAGYDFPHGLFDFVLYLGEEGSVATIVIVYPDPLPVGTVYWKYGSTAQDNTAHWYILPEGDGPGTVSFSADRRTITLRIQDSGLGDDDLTANSWIYEPGGPGVPLAGPAAPVSIPTMSQWGLIIMSVLFLLSALFMMRQGRI